MKTYGLEKRVVGRWLRALFLVFFLGLACLATKAQTPAPLQADYGDAGLRDWVQPEYPEAAKKAKLEGRVIVQFVVGPDGKVTQAEVRDSTNETFNEAALAAVRRWTFSPALEETKPVASGMEAPVVFHLAQLRQKAMPIAPPDGQMPQALKLTPAKFKNAPDPEYPPELEEQKLPGEVQIEFTVDVDGKPRAPRVLWASHAAFVASALRALANTQFEPARQGLLAKPMKMQYPVEFESAGARTPEILEANHITRVAETSPEALPTPYALVEPVYPREHLLAGERGAATVEFALTAKGRTTDVMLMTATAPEYGAALLAAVEAWGFKAGGGDGTFGSSRYRVVFEFAPPSDGTVARLAEALQPGGAGVAGPAGLDQKLKPVWRGFPAYPAALLKEQLRGTAEIEFIIDREGRVRLPRIKSATREEFGWAAATAISQWVFEPPTRKGEPADVTVSIPVNFTPPKPAS